MRAVISPSGAPVLVAGDGVMGEGERLEVVEEEDEEGAAALKREGWMFRALPSEDWGREGMDGVDEPEEEGREGACLVKVGKTCCCCCALDWKPRYSGADAVTEGVERLLGDCVPS